MSYKLLVSYNADTNEAEIIHMDEESAPRDLIVWSWDHFEQMPIYAPADAPAPTNKFDNHLNHKRKVEFESELAMTCLIQSKLFLPTLRKICLALVKLIENKNNQMQTLGEQEHLETTLGEIFKQVLYNTQAYFGRLGQPREAPSAIQCYKLGMTILMHSKHIEHILTTLLAAESILHVLHRSSHKLTLIQKHIQEMKPVLYSPDLFTHRGRIPTQHVASETSRAGIGDHNLKLPFVLKKHVKAIDLFTRDLENVSEFAADAYKREIPFVSGPSSHTAKLLYTAFALTEQTTPLNEQEKLEYTLCCAAYLIASGAHSFHEIYSVAKNIEINYKIGRYEYSLPFIFKQSPAYTNLLKKYPDIIKPDLNQIPLVAYTIQLFSSVIQPTGQKDKTSLKRSFSFPHTIDTTNLESQTTPAPHTTTSAQKKRK